MVRQNHVTAQQSSHKSCKALISLGFTVLPHPPCSPNLAPSDYTLFHKRMQYVVRNFSIVTAIHVLRLLDSVMIQQFFTYGNENDVLRHTIN